MTIILAASKQNKNVLTTTNPNDFIFHSNYNTFKIISTISTSFNIPANSDNVYSVQHSLNYSPLVYVFLKRQSSDLIYSLGTFTYTFIDGYYPSRVYTDNTYIYVKINNLNSYSITIYCKFFIFETPV